MIISGHHQAHSGSAFAGNPFGGHQPNSVSGFPSPRGDGIQISMDARMSVGGDAQSSNPLLAGLQDNFGPQGANQCGRQSQKGGQGAVARLRRGLERCEHARSPRERKAAGAELKNDYQSCKAQHVRLNPRLELKVVLTLLMMGAGDQQGGGQAGGGQQCPGGGQDAGDKGGCHKPKDKDHKHHDHDHHKGKHCKDKDTPHLPHIPDHGPKGGPARPRPTAKVA
ncbi:MAG: hypothetical protein KC910_19675 [Candidatus Eremiobacteraeota bacterium]|nr:hypothetical protein [Candidatus Eremiobacteraeota bacterium]